MKYFEGTDKDGKLFDGFQITSHEATISGDVKYNKDRRTMAGITRFLLELKSMKEYFADKGPQADLMAFNVYEKYRKRLLNLERLFPKQGLPQLYKPLDFNHITQNNIRGAYFGENDDFIIRALSGAIEYFNNDGHQQKSFDDILKDCVFQTSFKNKETYKVSTDKD